MNDLYVMEVQFKNIVLLTYHEDSLKKLDEVFNAFESESKKVRIHLKTVCETLRFKLKPSHGHPHNARQLEDLLANFNKTKSESWSLLSNTYIPVKVSERCTHL